MEGTPIEGGELGETKKVKVPRTHWDMLRERRSIAELEELLKERLDIIKTRRRGR
jgi:thioesterase domain-containing protein